MIENVKTASLGRIESVDQIPNNTFKGKFESYSYEKEDGKTIEIFNGKTEVVAKKSGKDDNFKFEIAMTEVEGDVTITTQESYYKADGAFYHKETDADPVEVQESEIINAYLGYVNSVYSDDEEHPINQTLIDEIDNNLKNVTQKGLNIYLNTEQDTQVTKITYNFAKQKITGFWVEYKYYTDNVLTLKIIASISL